MIDATLCISVAKNPGKFGITVHNAAFRSLGLNFIYKTFAVTDIAGVITGVRALGIRGCSISMPFKESVIPYLDQLDPIAKKIGAVNTVVNKDGLLIGYNTDVIGAYESLKTLNVSNDTKILLLGAGGVARAILAALQKLNLTNCVISSRRQKQARVLAHIFKNKVTKWEKRESIFADILINATPIGMKPNINQIPISKKAIKNFKVVMDVVATPYHTKLIKTAQSLGIKTIDGLSMALFQSAEQFRLYTGMKPPLAIMKKAALTLDLEK